MMAAARNFQRMDGAIRSIGHALIGCPRLRLPVRFLLMCCPLLPCLVFGEYALAEEPLTVSFRSTHRCGHNCLFAYLRLHGRATPLPLILEAIPDVESGATLAQLREVANRYGVHSTARRYTLAELADMRKPAIVHFRSREGHFVLLLKVSDGEVVYADMIECAIKHASIDKFLELWSGFAMTPTSSYWLVTKSALAGAALAAALVCLGPLLGRRRLAVLPLLLCSCSPGSPAARTPPVVVAEIPFEVPVHECSIWQESAPPFGFVVKSAIDEKFTPKSVIRGPSELVHHLQNWHGTHTLENRSVSVTCEELLRCLLNGTSHSLYPLSGQQQLVYIEPGAGPRIARMGERGSELHPSQVLGALAMLGVPSSCSLSSQNITVSIADLLQGAYYDVRLNDDLQWTSVPLVLYASGPLRWQNRWGEEIDFNLIAHTLVKCEIGRGDCFGIHRLIAMTILYRADEKLRLLQQNTRNLLKERLSEAVGLAARSQRPDGSWSPGWAFQFRSQADEESFHRAFDMDQPRLAHATGHLLEWMLMLPKDMMPPNAKIRSGIQWCVLELVRVSPEEVKMNFCPYSHCFRIVKRLLNSNSGNER